MLADVIRRAANLLLGRFTGTIATGLTYSTGSAHSNLHRIDRCQNGVLWAAYWDGTWTTTTSMVFKYSLDNGKTWTEGAQSRFGFSGTSTTYQPQYFSIFIDLNDFCHVVYKDSTDGHIKYRRGTPDASRTSWTWTAAVSAVVSSGNYYPDVIAHKQGTGWYVHVVSSTAVAANDKVYYTKSFINSSGTIGSFDAAIVISAATYANTVHKFPSIDFHHNGDGKTVVGTLPHLFVAWSAGATGAGKGIRFIKATYSGGVFTWGAEREIDTAVYSPSGPYAPTCYFDGTRVIIVGSLFTGGYVDLKIYERNVTDTTTTTHMLLNNPAAADLMLNLAATYDDEDNVYLFGASFESPEKLYYRKWTRNGAVLGAKVLLDDIVAGPYPNIKRGHSKNRIELFYSDGTVSPYTLKFEGMDA